MTEWPVPGRGRGGSVSRAWRRMGRSRPSRMPEDVRGTLLLHAGGMPASSRGSERSADPRIPQPIVPTPDQGSHNPAGRMPALRSARFDVEPGARVRVAAQKLSPECARTPIRPLSGTNPICGRTVGLPRSCGPRRHPRLLTTVAPSGGVGAARKTGSPCGACIRPLPARVAGTSDNAAVRTRRSGCPGNPSHAVTGFLGLNMPVRGPQTDGWTSRTHPPASPGRGRARRPTHTSP